MVGDYGSDQSRAGNCPPGGMIADNPLQTRADVQRTARALLAPLRPRFSPGRARLKLGATGTNYTEVGAQVEGFARALWCWPEVDPELWVAGLRHGPDPSNPEFWGLPGDYDQRFVEMAPLSLAMASAPQLFWEPLNRDERTRLVTWLSRINAHKVVDNNWVLFRVMANHALARLGAPSDPQQVAADLKRIEEFARGDGWYSDGSSGRFDYYIPSDIHFLKLVTGHFDRDYVKAFAHHFLHWFAADGAALPFGRSLTYRFAQGAFWGALALADVEALPWGVVKGLLLRHLRWWLRQPILSESGLLTVGYGYPNLNLAEEYNGPGSPYCAMKAFLPLALPETHPFWQAPELPLPDLPEIVPQAQPGFVICRDRQRDHVVALAAGQPAGPGPRHGAEKYAKFCYSTAFGFSVPVGQRGLGVGAHDSMLALRDGGDYWRVREQVADWSLTGTTLCSRWNPWPDVEIITWLAPGPQPWHVRVHCIRTHRRLTSAEGGFAQPAATQGTITGSVGDARRFELVTAAPNSNLLAPRTVIPTLHGEHAPGTHWLACAVAGVPAGELPAAPSFRLQVSDNKFTLRDQTSGIVWLHS